MKRTLAIALIMLAASAAARGQATTCLFVATQDSADPRVFQLAPPPGVEGSLVDYGGSAPSLTRHGAFWISGTQQETRMQVLSWTSRLIRVRVPDGVRLCPGAHFIALSIPASVLSMRLDCMTRVPVVVTPERAEAGCTLVPPVSACGALTGEAVRSALESARFDIQLDRPLPLPAETVTATLTPAPGSGATLTGAELTLPALAGIPLRADVRWGFADENGAALADGNGFALPDGPGALSAPRMRFALAPPAVAERESGRRTVRRVLRARVTLTATCPGGREVRAELSAPERALEVPALHLPSVLALFKNRDYAPFQRHGAHPGDGAVLLVVRAGLRTGPLNSDTLFGEFGAGAAQPTNAGAVVDHLTGLNGLISSLRLPALFPDNPLSAAAVAYLDSAGRLAAAVSAHLAKNTLDKTFVEFRAADGLRETNFNFINSPRFWEHVHVQDEVSSLILIGPPQSGVEIFNAPNFEAGEGVLRVRVDDREMAARLPNLALYTRAWSEDSRWGAADFYEPIRNLSRGRMTDEGTPADEGVGLVRAHRRLGGRHGLDFPGIQEFEHELSSFRFCFPGGACP